MNKAKKVYLDIDGNMTRMVSKWQREHIPYNYTEVDVNNVIEKKDLYLVNIEWINSGVTFWFVDNDGKHYPMTDRIFKDYLKENPVKIGKKKFEYLQQGTTYSIGFVS